MLARAPAGLWRFAIGCLIALGIGWRQLAGVLQGELANPDGYMRLVRIEDGLAAGRIGHAVLRDGSGAGTVLHWSHLLDSLLIAASAPFAAVAGWHDALFWAGALSGPASLGLLAVALGWAVAPLAGPRWLWAAPVLIGIEPGTLGYALPGVLHHHVLMAALVVVAAGHAGRMLRGDPGAGLRAGVAGAAAIWLSPETMPLVGLAFGLPVLAWLQAPRPGLARRLAACGAGFAAAIVLAWLVDPPADRFAAEIDRLSITYVALGAAAAAALALPLAGRRWLFLGAGAALLGAWAASFPALLRGPEGMMDERSARLFFDGIAEMLPITSFPKGAFYLLPGLLAAAYAAACAVAWRSAGWAYAAVCGLALAALGLWHIRFTTYGAAYAAALLPVLLTHAGARPVPAIRTGWRVAALLAFAILPPAPSMASGPDAEQITPPCFRAADAALLAPAAGRVVLTGVNDTPEVLYRTQALTVGSLYHRNVPAYVRLHDAWRDEGDGDVPATIRAAKVDYVLACRRVSTDEAPGSLEARLARGDVPRWLAAVGEAGAQGPTLYRVMAP